MAASLFQTSCRLGSADGLVVASLVRNSVRGDGGLIKDELEGLRAGFWTLTGFMGLGEWCVFDLRLTDQAAVLMGCLMKGWKRLDG